MSEEEIDQIRTAGILHDVGKVGVADAVLLKPARLTDDEFLEMQRHSTLGRDIVAGRGHAGDRRVGALPARALGRPRLPGQARGRGHPAREPRARRRRRVRGDDLLAPLPPRHAGREGAHRSSRSPPAQQFDPTVAQRMVDLVRSGAIPLGEIGVLDVTHYGSAASSASAAPPEEEGEPVRNVPGRVGRRRAAPSAPGAARPRARAPARPADRGCSRPRPSRSSPRTAGLQRRNSSTSRSYW